MARKVAGELLLAAAEENAELEVRRATAERQTSHLSHRLKLESAAHSELQKEYEILQQESMSRQREWESRQEEWESRQQAYESRQQERQQAYESRLQECESKHSARISELTIEHETLKETSARQLQWYRERNEMLEADTIRLREELEATKKQLSAAEVQASIPHVDEHLKGLAEQAVDAEAARAKARLKLGPYGRHVAFMGRIVDHVGRRAEKSLRKVGIVEKRDLSAALGELAGPKGDARASHLQCLAQHPQMARWHGITRL